jgi:ferredoxin-thioredoxin reductase catalytic subunit
VSDARREDVDALFEKLDLDAEAGGYRLNPDREFTKDLVLGLIVNEERYGYRACPCRLATGCEEDDLDIVCPCDYRDADVTEFGACYCALYVSEAVLRGEADVAPIPERRPDEDERRTTRREAKAAASSGAGPAAFSHPVWRCTVCGYLCARDGPPEICPICKAKRERFERFA